MNAITSMFKKPAAQGAHRAALAAHLATRRDLNAKTQAAQTAAAGTTARIAAAQAATTRLAHVNDALIAERAALETGTGSAEAVRELESQREVLRADADRLAEDARVAALVGEKHRQTIVALVAEQNRLKDLGPSLALPVLHHHLATSAAKFTAARDAYLAAAVETFGLAMAADEVAKSGQLGIFVGSGNLPDLVAGLNTVPQHPAFTRVGRDLYGEVRTVADQAIRDLTA